MKVYFNEKITLPIEIGSTVLFGKFLNKKGIVELEQEIEEDGMTMSTVSVSVRPERPVEERIK